MPNSSKYVLDTSVFIEAHRNYYPFDFARPFWDGLIHFAKEDRIVSIDRVYDEIMRGRDQDDPLKKWAKEEFSPFFDNTETEEILSNYRLIINWAIKQPQYFKSAQEEFAQEENADAWIVAYALTYTCIVVTQEVYNRERKNKIPIPNVCVAFKVPYINTYELLRRLNFSF
ncbi:DUF4411 domain-containing protein [Thermococci archaeon]|nr:MAG: DUF4411 domain-containing protein [Thermococci archaeon]